MPRFELGPLELQSSDLPSELHSLVLVHEGFHPVVRGGFDPPASALWGAVLCQLSYRTFVF